MKNYFYTTVLALALLTAYAVSQTGSYPSNNNPSPGSQNGTDKSAPQSDQAAPVDDQTLQSKISGQLATNPAFVNVTVAVKNGAATLEGKVTSKQDRKDAIKIAASVPGVKVVKDKLSVEPSAKTGDGAMNPAGPTSHWMAPQSTGSSQSSGQTGAGAASGMPQGETTTGSTDSTALQGQIETALKNEPTLANDNISVAVTDNAIALSGTVATRKERLTARRVALSYAGKRIVQDRITVSGAGSTTNSPESPTPRSPEDKSNPNQSPSNQSPPDQSTPK